MTFCSKLLFSRMRRELKKFCSTKAPSTSSADGPSRSHALAGMITSIISRVTEGRTSTIKVPPTAQASCATAMRG